MIELLSRFCVTKYKNYFKCVRNIFLINVYATQVNATLNSIDCCCTIVYKYYYYQLWRSIRTSARTYATLLIKTYMYTMLYYRWTVAQTRNTVYAEHRPLWLLWTEETELGRRCWLIKENRTTRSKRRTNRSTALAQGYIIVIIVVTAAATASSCSSADFDCFLKFYFFICVVLYDSCFSVCFYVKPIKQKHNLNLYHLHTYMHIGKNIHSASNMFGMNKRAKTWFNR